MSSDDAMNTAHLHLLFNHLPVLGTAFGLGILGFALWRRSQEVKQVAFGLLVVTALLAIPAYLTGEPAESVVKSLPGVSAAVIERHEEAAGVAFASLLALGVFAFVGILLFRRGRLIPVWFGVVVLVGAMAVSGLMAWTAKLGGEVRHTEIR